MEHQLVSEPMDFNYKDGNHVDFSKTFDLTGNDNDQMLKFYLRKAGLSDNIEYLTSEQRRAFIYDIVKSNKNPGYWRPSVLPQNPTPSRAPLHKTPVYRESSMTVDSIDDIPPASATFDLDSYRKIKNTNSNLKEVQTKSLVQQNAAGSTLYERQFSQKQSVPKKVVTSSPNHLPTTTLRTRKGRILQVSGPTDFRHIQGDMTRDMTKNTFDLSGNFNNNSLKKYMIERGITEEDISWLDRKDLIRRIVQSNYTWMPPRRQNTSNPIPPPPSETYVPAECRAPSTPRNINHSKGGAIIVDPPVLPETPAPSSEPVYYEIIQPKRNTTSIRRHKKKPNQPPPPPPPVLVSRQKLKNDDDSPQELLKNTSDDRIISSAVLPSTIPFQNCANTPPPPPPPPPPMPIDRSVSSKNIPTPTPPPPPPMPIDRSVSSKNIPTPPPPPPPLTIVIEQTLRTESFPPPPPPLPMPLDDTVSVSKWPPEPFDKNTELKPVSQIRPSQTGVEQQRDDFLQSIRQGVTLKKVKSPENQHENRTNGTPLQQVKDNPVPMETQIPVKLEKPDFMSELRNATLKRIKKLETNPYASESEC